MPSRHNALIVATVIKVLDPKVTYPYCTECYTKLQNNYSKNWHCLQCKIGYNACSIPQRYRLTLEIADSSALCSATVFGKILEPYFGDSANEIYSLFCLYDSKDILNLLNDFFTGKSFLFGFKTLLPLRESDSSISLLSVLKSSRKHCETLPTNIIASQMINCSIDTRYTIKMHLTRINSIETQNSPPPPTVIESSLRKSIESAPLVPSIFIERTNCNSTFPLLSQELIVLTCEQNPSGSQTSSNCSEILISNSGISQTPCLINSCTTKDLFYLVTKSCSTQTSKSFMINSSPDLEAGYISNYLLLSDEKVQCGHLTMEKHPLPEVSLADNLNKEIISCISDCENILDKNNSPSLDYEYLPGLPTSHEDYSMECSMNVNNNHVSYAPESEDLEAFLNSFNNSPHSSHEQFSEFHEKTEQNQMHKTQSGKNEMCFLEGYNFETPFNVASGNKSNLNAFTMVTANNIRTGDICDLTIEMIYWKTREINILSLLSFHSSTVTYFLLNLAVPYRFLKCVWKDNFLVSNNPRYKDSDKLKKSNRQSIGNMIQYSEFKFHNHNLNETNQFIQTRNKITPRKTIMKKDIKRFDKSTDLCLLPGPVKIVTKTHSNNENASNIFNNYPTKIGSTNEHVLKPQSTKRCMVTLNSTIKSKVSYIEESSPKLSLSDNICNIFPEDISEINLSAITPSRFHIKRMLSADDSINGSTTSMNSDSPFGNKVKKLLNFAHDSSLSTSSKQLPHFQEITYSPTQCLSKQDSDLERGPSSALNQSKRRKKCNLCKLYLQLCLCNDSTENKENLLYNGKKEKLCFSKKVSKNNNKNISQIEQFVNKTTRSRNRNQQSIPVNRSHIISPTTMKNQFSSLPYSPRVTNAVTSNKRTCLSLPHKNIDNSLTGFHVFSSSVNLRKCHSLTSTPLSHPHIYQPSYINLPQKHSSDGENIEHIFPITPIKRSSENQRQCCSNSPSIFSFDGCISESRLSPSVSLQQVTQESPKEQGGVSQVLWDPSVELFLPSPHPTDIILSSNTSEDLFNSTLKYSNHFIPQTPSNTPVSVRNISINTRDSISKSFNHQKSKNVLSKILLKRQIFKKINNSNLLQSGCQTKKLSPSNTIPKTTNIPFSPMKQHSRKDQAFIHSSKGVTENSTDFKSLFSQRTLSENDIHSPKATNYVNSKEISKCNSLIISKTVKNSFQNMEKSPELELIRKTVPGKQDLFSPEILLATQDETKHLFTFQNTNTICLDNRLQSCFKFKIDESQQQMHSPKLFKEINCDIKNGPLSTEFLQETLTVADQNSIKANIKVQNNTYLCKRIPKSCNRTLDIYASPDIFYTQPQDVNSYSHPSKDSSQTYPNTQTLSQSVNIFPPTLENTSVHNDTPNIFPETQTNVGSSVHSPDIFYETKNNSRSQSLSDIFSPTQESNQGYLPSAGPINHTPENIKQYLLSPDIFSPTQKNTQDDSLKSPDVFSQTQEPCFKNKRKYLYSLSQISSSTKNTPLQNNDALCKVLFCSNDSVSDTNHIT